MTTNAPPHKTVTASASGCSRTYYLYYCCPCCTYDYCLYFDETFAPVAYMIIVRILITMDATSLWAISQMDAKIGFLHDDLHEEVYMQ